MALFLERDLPEADLARGRLKNDPVSRGKGGV